MADGAAAPAPPPASRGPFAARLALKLVEDSLGPLCRDVVKCLIDHGIQQASQWGSGLSEGGRSGGAGPLHATVTRTAVYASRRLLTQAAPSLPAWPRGQYGDLARISKVPQQQLKSALLVLVQHNYVNVYLKQARFLFGGFVVFVVCLCPFAVARDTRGCCLPPF